MINNKKVKDMNYIEAAKSFLGYLMFDKEAPFAFLADMLKIIEKWEKVEKSGKK